MAIFFDNGGSATLTQITQSSAAFPRQLPLNSLGNVMTQPITLPSENSYLLGLDRRHALTYYRLKNTNKVVMGSATVIAFTNTVGGTNPTYLNGYGYIYPPSGFSVITDMLFFIISYKYHQYQQFGNVADSNDRLECDYVIDATNNRIRFTAYNTEQLNPSEVNYVALFRKETQGPM